MCILDLSFLVLFYHLESFLHLDYFQKNFVLAATIAKYLTENINFFQSQIDVINLDVINLQNNVNENSTAYFSLQDILYANDDNLQSQIDILNQIFQSLETNINASIELQNQLDNIQDQVSNLSDIVEQIQESISQE